MPPKTRRARDGPTSMPSQSTISFKHKISKSSASQHIGKDAAKKSSASKNILNQPAQEIVVEAIRREQEPQTQKTEDTTKLVDESPVRIVSRSSTTPQKGKRRVRRSLNDDEPDTTFEQCEQKALGLTDSQIERYWQQEEDKRLAPRGEIPFPSFCVYVETNVRSLFSRSTSKKSPSSREDSATL